MKNPNEKDPQSPNQRGSGTEQATEADRKGGQQPAKDQAKRDFEDSSKQSGE